VAVISCVTYQIILMRIVGIAYIVLPICNDNSTKLRHSSSIINVIWVAYIHKSNAHYALRVKNCHLALMLQQLHFSTLFNACS